MATDQSKQCVITNNSGKDIVIALSINADEGSSSNAITAANGQLEILKTSSGSTVIKNGSSDTITLDRSYNLRSGETGYVLNYDLQICDSNWMNPITHLLVTQQTINGLPGFEPQTVAATNGIMNSAESFYQTIVASPNSQLAKSYMAALQTAYNSIPVSFDAINQFFKNTQDYQQVTNADLTAVVNYYNNFPYIWARNKDSMIYYLYESGTNSNNMASFAGILLLQKSVIIEASKTNGGYTCLFMPAITPQTNSTNIDPSKAVTLTYQYGIFVDDPNSDVPNIGLKGTFLVKSYLTKNPIDTGIITIVNGAMNGRLCEGFDTPQILPS